jgi:membrane-associated phospholipid phosphatase
MTANHAPLAVGAQSDSAWTLRPAPGIVKHSLRWALVLLILFVAIYGSTNWVTSLRAERLRLWFEWELAIPLVPWMVWPYLSLVASFFLPMFVLDSARIAGLCRRLAAATVISGVCFLVLPAELGFTRSAPAGDQALAFQFIHALDLPHNLAPSLHVSWSLILLLTLRERSKWLVRRMFEIWLFLLLISVVLTHQHHLLDVLGGMLVALACYVGVRGDGGWLTRGKNR